MTIYVVYKYYSTRDDKELIAIYEKEEIARFHESELYNNDSRYLYFVEERTI